MAKKQTRRSVSIRGTTYDTVRAHCERSGLSMSEFMEQRIAGFFGDAPLPKPEVERRRRTPIEKNVRNKVSSSLDHKQLHDAARSFTF